MVVYIDVDDTLVRWASTKRIPIPRSIERVRSLHAEGAIIYLWSTGGSDYARSIATDLGIAECFTGFLPKPTLIIDDQAVQDWRDCKHEYPLQLSPNKPLEGDARNARASAAALGIQIEEMDVANIINVCDRKCRSVGLSALSSEERTVVLANWANFEVELGGLAAFFHNSTGTHAKEIVDALVELGAMEEAAAINQARELLRTRSLKELSMTGQFERLTDKFLASAPGLFVRLSAFVEVHRGELEATAQQCHAGDARNARA